MSVGANERENIYLLENSKASVLSFNPKNHRSKAPMLAPEAIAIIE
jgi:hypothetical protein